MLPGPISEIVPGCLRCVALATRSLLYLVHAGNSVDRIVWRRGVLGYAFAPSMMLGLCFCLSWLAWLRVWSLLAYCECFDYWTDWLVRLRGFNCYSTYARRQHSSDPLDLQLLFRSHAHPALC
jgi:hypothetical protein